ncbi:MAG: SHOCT domain-containing protein [Rubellimicrobium sp.]|nr:SHOCT domain-containing protein [Rubellimicrobium sp.]
MLKTRSGRPSLIGGAARTAGRTAVIVGTANAVSARQQDRRMAAAPPSAAAPAAAPAAQPAAAPASAGLSDDAIARLKQLAELHQSGILSDAEFEEQKARILNG